MILVSLQTFFAFLSLIQFMMMDFPRRRAKANAIKECVNYTGTCSETYGATVLWHYRRITSTSHLLCTLQENHHLFLSTSICMHSTKRKTLTSSVHMEYIVSIRLFASQGSGDSVSWLNSSHISHAGFKNGRLLEPRKLRQRPIWQIAHILPKDTLGLDISKNHI